MTPAPSTQLEYAFSECAADVDALYARCAEAAPNYGVTREDFATALRNAAAKFLAGGEGSAPPTPDEFRQFIGELQTTDLYLALACAQGNEHAWWDFDAGFRAYIERIARHLASAETQAEEVIDVVYTELYGTRVVEGVRLSKFATYSGRGTLKGWLRAVVWHAVVDMHRAGHDEISIEDWSIGGGEMDDRPGWRAEQKSSEDSMVDQLAHERYSAAATTALDAAFAVLGDHEKLLLLYYHVEGLKLREIARLVEEPLSPLRRWFQRQPKKREGSGPTRVHESTVMRWLEKVYAKVLQNFRLRLAEREGLGAEEIEVCIKIASEGLIGGTIGGHLQGAAENLSKGQ